MIARSLVLVAVTTLAAQQPQTETGTFVFTQNGAEVIVEKYTRTASSLESDLRIANGQRVTYKAKLAAGNVAEITMNAYVPTDTAKPAQTAIVRFFGDSLSLETVRNGAAVNERRAAPRGTVPFLNPSAVWMEEILRKAKTMGGATVNVSVAILNVPQEVITIPVTFTSATEATLVLGDATLSFKLDDKMRILSGEIPSEGLTILRR
jgi:hypothetical protein